MSKISQSLNLGNRGKFELHLVLTSLTEISKINAAKERNKPENQILSKEYKDISYNVGKLSRVLDWLRATTPVLFACGGGG